MSNKEIGAMGSVGFGDIDLYVFRTGSIINIKETKMEVRNEFTAPDNFAHFLNTFKTVLLVEID